MPGQNANRNNRNRPNRDRDRNRPGKGKGKGKGKGGNFDITAPYETRKQFQRERRAASRLQFQDSQRQLDKEQAAEQEMRNRIPAYFATYQSQLDQAAARTEAAYADASAKTQAAEQASQAYDTKLREQLAQEAQADAAIRGTSAGNVSADSAAAASSRSQASVDFSQLVAAQAATQQGYFADKKVIGRGEEASQMMKSHAREASINEDQRALAKEKGAFNTDFRRQERGAERDYQLSNKEFSFQRRENAKDRALELGGRDSQMDLARQYGRNERRSQNRSLRNQLAVTDAQSRAERADDRRTRRRDDRVQSGYNRAERQDDARTRNRDERQNAANRGSDRTDRAAEERKAASWLRSAPARYGRSRQAAIDYLVNRSISPAVARKVVNRMMGGGSSGTTSANAALND